jgi:hypothetical protein
MIEQNEEQNFMTHRYKINASTKQFFADDKYFAS